MSDPTTPPARDAAAVPPRAKASIYPAEFAKRVAGREKRALGEHFGLKAFGVHLTRLAPGSQSALRHRHTRQDEFLYVLEGEPTLVTDAGEMTLRPGMCAGFPAGGTAHYLVNRTERAVVFLEVGDRPQGDEVIYPVCSKAATAAWKHPHAWHFFAAVASASCSETIASAFERTVVTLSTMLERSQAAAWRTACSARSAAKRSRKA